MPATNYSLRFLLFHPVIWFLVATISVTCLATVLWEKYNARLVDQAQYSITDENLQISSPPAWLQEPLKSSLRVLTNSGKSLLDTDTVPAAREFATSLPWVRSVERVEKNAAGLQIAVTYREPIAMVDPIRGQAVPVDGDGVVVEIGLLDSNERSRLQTDLMRINMPWLQLETMVPWMPVADRRIRDASHLVEYLNTSAAAMGLFRVVTYDRPSRLASSQPQWEIWTRNRTRVFWGSAPGSESNRESSATEKMSALQQFVSKFGPLEDFESKESLKIDVSTGTAVLVKAARLAELDNWSKKIK